MAVQYAPLFALETQFQAKNGRNLTGGFLRVFYAATDDPADTYSDYNLTRNPDRIVLDDNGRALVICDKSKAYRLEVYDADGMLLWTEEPVYCSGTGGGGVSITKVISTDGSISIDESVAGSTTTYDIGLGVDMDRLNPSCLSADATPRNSDGKFVFGELFKEGDLLSVDNYGCVRCEPASYHFTAIVELSYDRVATNSSHQITLYTTLSNSVVDFDLSYAHRESIELSGDIHVVESNSEFVLGVTGLPNGVIASLVDFDIHAITGHEGNTEYHAGEGITIVNATKTISADFESVQEKLVAGENISITGNVISAGNFSQAQADWTEEDTTSRSYIRNKPDLDVFATKTEVNTGLATKQDTINDLAQIRAGAASGSSAVQPSDLAAVATTGDYNSLNNRPNLTVYATKTEVNTGLEGKQDVISDLSAIRAGAQAGATAVQPAALDSYATKVELNTGLSGKQDTINDLSEIRSGAAAGATALQHSDVATVATTGDYADLSNRPTIPSGPQLVPAATSADADKVLTVDAQGTPAWATAQAPISAGDGVEITNNVVSAKVDGTTVTFNASGELQAAAAVTVDQTYDASSTNAQSGTAVAQAIGGVDAVPDVTSSDNGKVLVANYSGGAGSYAWASNPPANAIILNSSSTWDDFHTPYSAGRKDIYYKHTSPFAPFDPRAELYLHLTAVSDVDGSSTNFTFALFEGAWHSGGVDYSVMCKFRYSGRPLVHYTSLEVDQSYSPSSSHAQSGVAVSQAISAVNQVPESTSEDADKVLTVDAQGTPAWASAKAPISAGTGIDITNNVVSVDTSVVATQTDLAGKQDTISDLATIRSGAAEGATAVQPGDLATVATTGSYNDLSDKPSIPAAQVNSDWNASSGVAEILNKPQLSTVATTGDYDDLVNKPSIPAAQVNSDWNAVSGVSEILNKPSIPTATSDLTNDSGFITLSDVPAQAQANWAEGNRSDPSYIQNKPIFAMVAITGDYTDLTNTPTIPAAQVNADWNSSSGASEILNKPSIPSGAQLVPAATSADADKVLTVNAQGTPEWATGGGSQVQSDWTEADSSAPSYIENKPVPKTLTAGTGIHITENASTITVASSVTVPVRDVTVDGSSVVSNGVAAITMPTPPTVDQTYDASSTNAQSGVAVADAIGNLATNLSAAQLLAFTQAMGVDETVLWDGNGTPATISDLGLYESVNNFERVRITFSAELPGGGPGEKNIQDVERPTANGNLFSVVFSGGIDSNLFHIYTGIFAFSTNGTKFTYHSIYHCWDHGSGSYEQANNSIQCLKVVGIHRIASN